MATIGNLNGTHAVADGAAPHIHLYTNHGCPYAHRVHITLNELGLPYEETIIDLTTPREPWYLDINPRGLVPAIKFSNGILKDAILTESGVVMQFLAEMLSTHLIPQPLNSPYVALFRARVKFFIDTWDSKIQPQQLPILKLDTLVEKKEKCKEWLQILQREIEPLLHDANPFFGGSDKMTLAEVNAAPFILRWHALSNDELLPASFVADWSAMPHFSKWSSLLLKHESATDIFDAQGFKEGYSKRIAKMKAQGN